MVCGCHGGFRESSPSDMSVTVAAVKEPRRVENSCSGSTGSAQKKEEKKMVQGFKSKKTTTTPKNNRHKAQSVKKGGE